MMKIVFDSRSEDVEHHARHLHREMLRQKKLPRLPGVTRAIIPGYCDDCGERAWEPIMGGVAFCADCRAKREARGVLGFGA